MMVRPLGLAGAVVSAIVIWLTMSATENDPIALAIQVGGNMGITAFLLIPVAYWIMFLHRERFAILPRNKLAIAFTLIGIFGGVTNALIYFLIGFQLPTMSLDLDTIVHWDYMLPAMPIGTILMILMTTLGVVAGALMYGQKSEQVRL